MASGIDKRYKGVTRAKCCAHFFNLFLMIIASAAIGVSVWIFITIWQHPAREGALHIVGIYYYVCNIVPAGVGIIVLLIGFIGVCGLCSMHRCTLLWYFSLIIVAFVLTIGGGIFNFIFYFQLQGNIASSLLTNVKEEYGLYGFEELTQSINSVQIQFECCGSTSYTEWITSEWHRIEGLSHFRDRDVPTIPPSCCTMTSDNMNAPMPMNLSLCSHRDLTYPNEYMHSQNCSELLYKWLELFTLILAIACAALFLAELMTVVALAVLFRRLGPVHYEEKKLMNRLQGNPDWEKRHKRRR
ncbi:tetraspanin-18-like [Asterias amurensis]|uniref:tetraspanin-18-like n=1 Tax=Asterias amurensis TaxID=7602 RepID=UPI003AB34446